MADAGLSVDDVLPCLQEDGAAFIIYTDIERDGMQCGVNLTALRHLAETSTVPVIAAGAWPRWPMCRPCTRSARRQTCRAPSAAVPCTRGTLDLVEANAWIAAQQ